MHSSGRLSGAAAAQNYDPPHARDDAMQVAGSPSGAGPSERTVGLSSMRVARLGGCASPTVLTHVGFTQLARFTTCCGRLRCQRRRIMLDTSQLEGDRYPDVGQWHILGRQAEPPSARCGSDEEVTTASSLRYGRGDGHDVGSPPASVPIIAGDDDQPTTPGLSEDLLGIARDLVLGQHVHRPDAVGQRRV